MREQDVRKMVDSLYYLLSNNDEDFYFMRSYYDEPSFCAGFAHALFRMKVGLSRLAEDSKRPRCKICGRAGITADDHFCIYDEEDTE